MLLIESCENLQKHLIWPLKVRNYQIYNKFLENKLSKINIKLLLELFNKEEKLRERAFKF